MPIWDKHEVTPEARKLVDQARAEATLERLERENPTRLRHYVLIGLAGVALIALPLLAISLLFDLSSFLSRIF